MNYQKPKVEPSVITTVSKECERIRADLDRWRFEASDISFGKCDR